MTVSCCPCPADFEYEVGWQGLASLKFNRWLPRAELIEKGFRKFVIEFDQRLASSALGNDARPLTKESITKFLQDFGLDPEFGVHSNIRGLSGGQKVKLVLAVSTLAPVCSEDMQDFHSSCLPVLESHLF